MIRILAWVEDSDLANLQTPAMPDGLFVRGQDGKAAKAAGGVKPTLDVSHPVDGKLEDLCTFMLEKLELTPKWSSTDLPETKVPPGKHIGQLVEVTGAQRPQLHEPSPVAEINRRQVAVFRLECTHFRHRLEEFEKRKGLAVLVVPRQVFAAFAEWIGRLRRVCLGLRPAVMDKNDSACHRREFRVC